MASQHYINLSASEMSVVASAKKNGKGWMCKACKQNFGDVVPLVTHLLTSCDDKNKTFETSSLVNVCVHLDPNGCQKMLESYIRVYGVGHAFCFRPRVSIDVLTSSQVDPRIQTAMGEGTSVTDNSTIDDDETMTDDSAIDSSNRDSKGKAPAELDAPDHDLLGHDQSSQDSGGSQEGANAAPAGSEFAATPPEWLSDKDKAEWRVRQDRKLALKSPILLVEY
jgi:hypothetical protein